MVGSSLDRLVCGRFRAAVVWAMIPLAIWSGQLSAGCICADGHYEPFCRAHLCPGRHAGDAEQAQSACSCCGCSWCARASSTESSRVCCTGDIDCCHRPSSPHQPVGIGQCLQGKACCTPVVQSQVIPPVVTSSRLAGDHHLPALCATILDVSCPVIGLLSTRRLETDTGPPLDLVVKLRRLVI